LDTSGSIKFTYEVEQDGRLPFLDLLLVRTDSSALKIRIYRKPHIRTSIWALNLTIL